jgi:hypothetical protein
MSNDQNENNYLKDLKSMRSKKSAEFAAQGSDLPNAGKSLSYTPQLGQITRGARRKPPAHQFGCLLSIPELTLIHAVADQTGLTYRRIVEDALRNHTAKQYPEIWKAILDELQS